MSWTIHAFVPLCFLGGLDIERIPNFLSIILYSERRLTPQSTDYAKESYYFQENADADENDYFQEFGHLDVLFEETCAGDLLKTEFSFTPIKKKEKELKEIREKAREDARKNRGSEKIPVSGEELGFYLYEKYKADEPDPLGLSDLEKKLENKEKELKRAGDPRVMEAYAGLSEVSDALNALNMMASTAAYSPF